MQKIHTLVEQLGNKIYSSVKGPLTIVGLLTGGQFIADDLTKYFKSKGIKCKTFNIKVDTDKGKVIQGEDLIKEDGTTYLFVDDAIWAARTKMATLAAVNKNKIKKFKYAVILDPYRKADFSVYS